MLLTCGSFNASLEIRINQHLPGKDRCGGYYRNGRNCPQSGCIEAKQWRWMWLQRAERTRGTTQRRHFRSSTRSNHWAERRSSGWRSTRATRPIHWPSGTHSRSSTHWIERRAITGTHHSRPHHGIERRSPWREWWPPSHGKVHPVVAEVVHVAGKTWTRWKARPHAATEWPWAETWSSGTAWMWKHSRRRKMLISRGRSTGIAGMFEIIRPARMWPMGLLRLVMRRSGVLAAGFVLPVSLLC